MLASRLLLRAPRSKAIATAGLRLQAHASSNHMASGISQSRLFSSVQKSHTKRPSILLSTVRQSYIASLTSARFKSTAASPPPTTPTPADQFAPFDSVSPLDFTSLTEVQKAIPEQIGFLKELGLDFGWGPTTCMQWLLEHVHIWSGQPWWVSIVLATIIIRLVQFPAYLRLSDVSARMREAQPFIQPLMEKYQKAQVAKDLVSMHLARKEMNELYTKAGIKKLWMFFPLTQIPVFYGFYNLLRSMAEAPVPGLLEGGTAWFSNLSVPDPFFILPLISAGSIALTFAAGGDAGAGNMNPSMRKFLMYGLPLLSLVFMWNWAAAMTVYFAASGILGFIQGLALRSTSVRKAFDLYPLAQPEPAKTPLVVIDTEQSDSRANLASKVKGLLSVENTPPMVKNVSNWMSENSKDRVHSSYESRRKAEETARKRELIEKKRRRAMKGGL